MREVNPYMNFCRKNFMEGHLMKLLQSKNEIWKNLTRHLQLVLNSKQKSAVFGCIYQQTKIALVFVTQELD